MVASIEPRTPLSGAILVVVGDRGDVRDSIDTGRDLGSSAAGSPRAVNELVFEGGSHTSAGSRHPTPVMSRFRFRNCAQS
jgi:hypothetical protein